MEERFEWTAELATALGQLSFEWIAGLAQSRAGLLQILGALSTTVKNSQQAVLDFGPENTAMVSLSVFQGLVEESPQGSTVTAGSVADEMEFPNAPLIDVRFDCVLDDFTDSESE